MGESNNNHGKIKIHITYSVEGSERDEKCEIGHEIQLIRKTNLDSIGQDPTVMMKQMLELMILSISKGVSYGSSYKSKGEVLSIFPNLMRKYERVEKSIMDQVDKGVKNPSPRIDGTADLAVYCLLYLQFLEKEYPLEYMSWFNKEVKSYIEDQLGPWKTTIIS